VYGAWPNNPVPLTEDEPLRPNASYLPAILDGECERMLADWASAAPDRVATRLRLAPVVGGGARSLFASVALGRGPVPVRGAAPVQVVHADDAAAALALAAAEDLDGAFNVAADGWLAPEEARAMRPGRGLPGLPRAVAERVLAAGWATGALDAPPSVLPYLVEPWVVANDRIVAAGWKPRHGNDEAILLATPTEAGRLLPVVAGAGAIAAGVAIGAWWWRRRRVPS